MFSTNIERMAPPAGVIPNFDYSHPRFETVNQALVGVGLGISTSCLIMRIYTKCRLLQRFWWDDVCVLIAWSLSVASQALIMYGYAAGGFGIHQWNLTSSTLAIYRRVILATSIIYVSALAFSKFSVIMLYYLIWCRSGKWKYIAFVTAAVIAAYTLALILALIFACSPISIGWEGKGSCLRRTGIYLASVITNVLSDIALIAIPIPMMRKLRLPLIQKVGVMLLFGVGCLTLITSILRLGSVVTLLWREDQSYHMSLAIIFVLIEVNFIVVCSTLPYLRQFLRYYAPRWIGEGTQIITYQTSPYQGSSRKPKSAGLSPNQGNMHMAWQREDMPPDENHTHIRETPTPTVEREQRYWWAATVV